MNLLRAGLQNHLKKVSQLFNEVSETVALRIPMQRCPEFLAKLQEFLINEEGVQSITREPDQVDFEHRLLLLNKSVDEDLKQLPSELKEWVEVQKIEVKKFKIVKDVRSFSLESAIAKVISDESVDPHVKIETVQGVKILDLSEEQKKFKHDIAALILERNGFNRTTTAVIERTIQKDNAWFFVQEFKHLVGDSSCRVDLTEGSCRFSLEVPRVFFRNLFQEDRDTLLQQVAQHDSVVNIFGEIILDTRLVKERSAQLQVYLASNALADLYTSTQRINNPTSQKSLARSLSQPTEVEPQKGSLETSSGDLFQFFKKVFSDNEPANLPHYVFISEILKDLSILSALVGINQNAGSSSIAVHFYLLVNEEEYAEKSVEDIVINSLNAKTIEISAGSVNSNLFEKRNLGSVAAINFDVPKRKLLSVNMTISGAVLAHSTSLIDQVASLYNQIEATSISKIPSNQPQDLSDIEGQLVKKPKVSA